MSSINNRIFEIMDYAKIKQVDFAKRVGVSQAYISKLLKSNTEKRPSDRLIRIICEEFGINEDWLKTGKGEMLAYSKGISFDEFIKQNNATPLEAEILKLYLSIEPSKRKEALNAFKVLLNITPSNNDTSKSNETSATLEKKIEKKVELYRKELIDAEKGATLSVIQKQRENII